MSRKMAHRIPLNRLTASSILWYKYPNPLSFGWLIRKVTFSHSIQSSSEVILVTPIDQFRTHCWGTTQMGGHSHWATTKRHKSAQDAKRGRIFTKVIREVTTAAKIGGGDPDGNPRLRTAIAKAKEVNMPVDNIKKAILRGTGELPGVNYEEGIYEGYGPGGVAIMVEIMTDNRNRTVSEIRNLLSKYGGSMGEAGCVSWVFNKKGYIVVERSCADEEKLLGLILEAGAEDLRIDEKNYEVISAPSDFENVKKALEDINIPITLAEITMVPQNYVEIEGKDAEQMLKMMEALEDHDDVQKVYANFNIPDELVEKVATG
jgi:YebC/PmpR family DNA-binding regulatory protein